MPNRPLRRPRLLAALTVLLLMTAACANQPIEGGDGTTPTLPEGGATLPETTQAPETTQVPETPPEEAAPADPENAEQDGLSGEDWLLLGLIALAVTGIIAWVASASAKRSQQRALGASVSALRRALDTYVRLRTEPEAQPTLIESATASVTNARTQLQSALTPVAGAAVA